MHLKILPAKWGPFCPRGDELKYTKWHPHSSPFRGLLWAQISLFNNLNLLHVTWVIFCVVLNDRACRPGSHYQHYCTYPGALYSSKALRTRGCNSLHDRLPGVGVTKASFVTFSVSLKLKIFDLAKVPVRFFDRCHHSWTAATPVKYKCDIQYLTCVLIMLRIQKRM